MYHFVAEQRPEPLRLSFRVQVPGRICQYLKAFQLEAICFLYAHLTKGEFCVLNDESGLGKTAAVAVLLDAAAGSKKCLIVVQNEDSLVTGWQFHFSVLTSLSVLVIKDDKDSSDTVLHNVCIAKWNTLRTIDDVSRFQFDIVIVDNRGEMLSNGFCAAMLLKHYERKVNILISSVDITSDLKLLHKVLRLGGRLEPRFGSFREFEETFRLPEAKGHKGTGLDLEEYFRRRERLADYCKPFRLRRYWHQYEHLLPLVAPDRYKININLWREAQMTSNPEGGSAELLNELRADVMNGDTQELFETYCSLKRRQQYRKNQKSQKKQAPLATETTEEETRTEKRSSAEWDEQIDETSDESVIMSPLLLVSESDTDSDRAENRNDHETIVETIAVPSEGMDRGPSDQIKNDKEGEGQKAIGAVSARKLRLKRYRRGELEKLKEDIKERLKLPDGSVEEARGPRTRLKSMKTSKVQLSAQMVKKSEVRLKRAIIPSPSKALIKEESKCCFEKKLSKRGRTKTTSGRTRNTSLCDKLEKLSSARSKSRRYGQRERNVQRRQLDSKNGIKGHPKKSSEKAVSSKRSLRRHIVRRERQTREFDMAAKVVRTTRSMQRMTRSAGSRISNKYMTKNLALRLHKSAKRRRAHRRKERNCKCLAAVSHSADRGSTNVGASNVPATQLSVLFHSSTSNDYEHIECGQKLDDDAVAPAQDGVIPMPPEYSATLPPSSSFGGFFEESEVVFIPPSASTSNSKEGRVIVLSSPQSENDASSSPSAATTSIQSRRTRALKQKRSQMSSTPDEGAAISKRRANSPDLFSNCSDSGRLMCTQTTAADAAVTNRRVAAVEDSRISSFGLRYSTSSLTTRGAVVRTSRGRSCLEILEKMFEPSGQNSGSSQATSTRLLCANGASLKQKVSHPINVFSESIGSQQPSKRKRQPLADDDGFERRSGTLGNEMRSHSNGNVAPATQTQRPGTTQHKITSYLIGGGASGGAPPLAESGNGNSTPKKRLSAGSTAAVRKSPKAKTSPQTTKLTKWLVRPGPGRSEGDDESASVSSSSVRKALSKQQPPERTQNVHNSETPSRRRVAKR